MYSPQAAVYLCEVAARNVADNFRDEFLPLFVKVDSANN